MNRKRQWLKAAAWVLAVVVVLAAAAVFAGLQLAQQKMQRKVDIKVQPVPGATGDQALAHLAQVARECMRPQDTLARYGGEEFVLLLPETDAPQAQQLADELLQRMAARKLPHPAASAAPCVTLSLGGITTIPASSEVAPDFFERADAALYQAKAQGRNRWCWAPAT